MIKKKKLNQIYIIFFRRIKTAILAFVSDLELSSVVHPMVYLEGAESADF